MRIAALIVAAGRGTRAGGGTPKQYRLLGQHSLLARSLAAFHQHAAISTIQIVVSAGDEAAYAAATGHFKGKLRPPVLGGADRQASVLAGLEALTLASPAPDLVLVHDAARPFVSQDIIARVIEGLAHFQGCIAAVPLADTLKREGDRGIIAATLARDGLWRAQTPQGFDFAAILAAHRQARTAGRRDFTDDAAVAEWAGLTVGLVPGAEGNRKMTTPEDFELARPQTVFPDIRTGSGFDVHRFMAGDHVMLCGIAVPHTAGVDAHSDGDVALHALTDALLGAIGAGDIGQHFPPSDARWKNASSSIFLAEASRLVRARGGQIGNADITILCESPRIGPHREAMRARIAEILGIAADRVSVKATTTEKLGFTGRAEGLAAMATATILLPSVV